MNQLINTKELSKQIRYYGSRGSIIWTREENQHFITNRHFLVRYDELPNEILAALFGVFYKLLGIGESIQVQHGAVLDVTKPIDYKKIYVPEKQNIVGESTPYLRDMGRKKFARVIKFPSYLTLIDEDYMKLSDAHDNPKSMSNSQNVPIYLAEGNLLLLPYRISDDSKIVNDLLGADKK